MHGSRFVDRNDPVFGSPWSTGLGADRKNGIGQLTTLESSAKSLFRGLTLGMQKQMSQHFQFQMNYQLSEDLADDDNERDPFTYRYAVANNFKPDYGFSDRMERHRFNAFGLWQAPWGIEFSPLISYPFAAAHLGGEPRAGQRLHRQAQHAVEGQQLLRVRFPRRQELQAQRALHAAGHRGCVQPDATAPIPSIRRPPACCSISTARCRAAWAIRGRPNSACG